jgi:leucyl/phenylalanyl-tRNA--protein transferase
VRQPIEPPASQWNFGDLVAPGAEDLVAVGGSLEPGTILAAYRAGLFPMEVSSGGRRRQRALGWWSPDPRGVLPLDGLRVTRSLRRSCRRYSVQVDRDFERVMRECADPNRPGGWINDEFVEAYCNLHRLGWAHSFETYDDADTLVGGLYGIAIGGLFAGESMFHHRLDASKVALVALVERLRAWAFTLLDVQWSTTHLESLGSVAIERDRYLLLLEQAIELPELWGGRS